MITCNTCLQAKEKESFTRTNHGRAGEDALHSRCKACDTSRKRLQSAAARNHGFKKARNDEKWIALSRPERADITTSFMEYLRHNDHPIIENLDPGYCAAYGFKGTPSITDVVASKKPKRQKVRVRSGPKLKAMPRIESFTPGIPHHEKLVSIRERNSVERARMANEQTTLSEGFVYVITNPAWPGKVKIGSALDYVSRLNSYQTGDPFRSYALVHVEYFEDRKGAENTIHHAQLDKRVNGEWFSVSPILAQEMITDLAKQVFP